MERGVVNRGQGIAEEHSELCAGTSFPLSDFFSGVSFINRTLNVNEDDMNHQLRVS